MKPIKNIMNFLKQIVEKISAYPVKIKMYLLLYRNPVVIVFMMSLMLFSASVLFADTVITDNQDYQGTYNIKDVNKIGVGTDSPTTELDVVGTIKTDDLVTKGPWIDLRYYGAIGNGTTDDTTAVQNAFNAVPASGGTVFVPKGAFLVDYINLPSNVLVMGNGSFKKKDNASSLDILRIVDKDNVTLLGITIDSVRGTGSYPPAESYNCLSIKGDSSNIKVLSCEFLNAENSGIYISDNGDDPYPKRIIISGNHFNNSDGCGIEIEDIEDAIISDNIIKNSGYYGIRALAPSNSRMLRRVLIQGNQIDTVDYNNGIEVYLTNIDPTKYYGIHIVDNKVSNTSHGIKLNLPKSAILNNTIRGTNMGIFCSGAKTRICGNSIIDMDSDVSEDNYGIYVLGEGCVISDNIVDEAPSSGIRLYTNSHKCVISNNQISNSGQYANGSYKYGIWLDQVQDCIVDGNNVYDDQETATQLVGIYVRSKTENGTNNVISDNHVSGNASSNITISDADLQKVIQGNSDSKYDRVRIGGKVHAYGTAVPTSGTWNQGDIFWNTSPSASGAPGWVCTTGGTPGIWKAMASLAL